jgi:hypothetical protein
MAKWGYRIPNLRNFYMLSIMAKKIQSLTGIKSYLSVSVSIQEFKITRAEIHYTNSQSPLQCVAAY